ncbi:MAG: hypothetical protein SGARI_003213 [Bacillariaceae sp.]
MGNTKVSMFVLEFEQILKALLPLHGAVGGEASDEQTDEDETYHGYVVLGNGGQCIEDRAAEDGDSANWGVSIGVSSFLVEVEMECDFSDSSAKRETISGSFAFFPTASVNGRAGVTG